MHIIIIIPVPLTVDGDNHKFEQAMFVLILAEEICFSLSLSFSLVIICFAPCRKSMQTRILMEVISD